MAQDYEVLQFKAGDFKDQNNNFWCEMALKGVGEPVRIAVRDPQQFHEGMTLYGTVNDAVSKAGKPYLRFKREAKEEQHGTSTSNHGEYKSNYVPRDDNAIRAQWAIGQAVHTVTASGEKLNLKEFETAVYGFATSYYAMVERVKGSQADPVLKAQPPEPSGYDKFVASRPKTEEPSDPEFASMLSKGMEADGINMDDTPFN